MMTKILGENASRCSVFIKNTGNEDIFINYGGCEYLLLKGYSLIQSDIVYLGIYTTDAEQDYIDKHVKIYEECNE